MKVPQKPPSTDGLFSKMLSLNKFDDILRLAVEPTDDYLHWDKLRHLTPPEGLTPEEWWLGIKLRRQGLLKPLPLSPPRSHRYPLRRPPQARRWYAC